jgi:CDP-paratose 2-epimerase
MVFESRSNSSDFSWEINMRYLITGGCGFLGTNLAEEVLRKREDLCIFDNLSRIGSQDNLRWLKGKGQFRFEHRDIRSAGDVEKVIRNFRPDVIFHLAGQVAMTTSIENPRLDFEVNTLGTLNLLEASRLHAPYSTVIYSSTNKVYGELEWVRCEEQDRRYIAPDFPRGFDEAVPLDFRSPYGCSKGAADQYVLDYARIFGLKTVVFRHSSMYGGRQFATFDQGWIGWFCKKAIETKNAQLKGTRASPFTISGSGKQVRDVLHAEDVVHLYFQVVDHIDQQCGNAFNIGGGMKNSLSILELFHILERLLDLSEPLKFTKLAPRISDQKVFVADTAKILRASKWAPSVPKESGIEMMLGFLQSEN